MDKEPAKTLDKDQFTRHIPVLGIQYPASKTSEYLKELKDHLLNMPKQPNVAKDFNQNGQKLLLLSQKYTDKNALPEDLTKFVNDNTYQVIEHRITLTYDDMNPFEVLEQILPKDITVPAGFESVGSIAHFNLRKNQYPYKELIGQVILDKNKSIKTVVNKVDKLNNVFRTPELEIIAGDTSLETIHIECGAKYKLNFEKVYWCSKLQGERDRLLKIFKKEHTLCDMFCGIGPLCIRAAKAGINVIANDLNPECFKYLEINSKLNKVDNLIDKYNMDAREFMRKIVVEDGEDAKHFDYVYMNLPVDACEFLDIFYGLFTKASPKVWNSNNLPEFFVSGFDAGKDIDEVKKNFTERIVAGLKNFDESELTEVHQIKEITSDKKMYCIRFKLSEKVAFADVEKEQDDDDGDNVEKKIKVD